MGADTTLNFQFFLGRPLCNCHFHFDNNRNWTKMKAEFTRYEPRLENGWVMRTVTETDSVSFYWSTNHIQTCEANRPSISPTNHSSSTSTTQKYDKFHFDSPCHLSLMVRWTCKPMDQKVVDSTLPFNSPFPFKLWLWTLVFLVTVLSAQTETA